ncbi:MAG: hypothetical protein QOE14_1841 [Humisphaera sp.]|nr:hypothetical protein [Humisphaera sp.]
MRALQNLLFLTAIGVTASAADAGVLWISADRYIRSGADMTPTPAGQMQGFQPILAPKASATGFQPFNASQGSPYPNSGASQVSSIEPLTIDVVSYGYSAIGQSSTLNYTTTGIADNRCTVVFSLDAPTGFTLTVNPTPAEDWPVVLTRTGGPSTNYFANGNNPAVHTGTLAAGTWTFNATYSGWLTPYGIDAHMVLAPEPSSAVLCLAVAGGALLTRRRSRSARTP